MDIKWKKFVYNPIVKLVAFIVASVCMIIGIYTIVNDNNKSYYNYGDYGYNYYNNDYSYRKLRDLSKNRYSKEKLNSLIYSAEIVAKLESEEAIRTKSKYIKKQTITHGENGTEIYEENLEELEPPRDVNIQVDEYDYSEPEIRYYSEINGEWQESESAVKSMHIQMFTAAMGDLEKSGVSYEIKTGDKDYKKGDMKSPYSVTVKDLVLKWNVEEENKDMRWGYDYTEYTSIEDPEAYVYLGTDGSGYDAYVKAYLEYRQYKQIYFILLTVLSIVGLCAVLILTLGAGRKSTDRVNEIHLGFWDKPYLDISLGIVLFVSLIAVTWTNDAFDWFFENYSSYDGAMSIVVGLFPFTLLLVWWTSFVKRFQLGRWWRYTLVYNICSMPFRKIKEHWKKTKDMPKKNVLIINIVIVTFLMLMTMLPPMILITLPIMLIGWFVLFKDICKIDKAISSIEAGNFKQEVGIKYGLFASMASSLENISGNMDNAVQSQLKSERLKTELITNVSHDLRTPLTSIITYADLLKNKGLQDKQAPEYLDILIQKSNRLKVLTDDLFEATKASSGNIAVNLEELDFSELINQCFGEMEALKVKSGLDFHIQIPESAMIKADGRLMQRVLENLLSNVFKYSLPKSRVYLDLTEQDQWYKLELKNISEYPLNISTDELTQRFSRGDSSRATEGSGLGLSIVESFVLNQKGNLKVIIDGDLFKVEIEMPKA